MIVSPKKVFTSIDLHNYYSSLGKNHKHRKWIKAMREILSENMLIGEKIRKNRMPRDYIRKYNVSNLYRYAHPEGFRSTYTIQLMGEDGFCPIILDFLSHNDYEQVFDYQGLL